MLIVKTPASDVSMSNNVLKKSYASFSFFNCNLKSFSFIAARVLDSFLIILSEII